MTILARAVFLVSIFIFTAAITYGQKEARIGDTVPDLVLTMVNHEKPTIKLSELRGKAVIIDFWGTWCAPCVASFPKLDSIQKALREDLYILPVTDEDRKTVEAFLIRYERVKKIKPSSVIEDKELSRVFPHTQVPHYVWIDQQGVVRAITYPEDVTFANIQQFIKTGKANFAIKREPAPIRKSPLQAMAEDTTIVRFEALSKYIPGMYSGLGARKNMVIVGNCSLLWMFGAAYGEGTLKFIGGSQRKLITTDSLKFTPGPGKTQQFKNDWVTNHTYNYVLKVPLEDSAKLYRIMQENLKTLFPAIKAKIIQEERECYVLKSLNNSTAFQLKKTVPFSQAKGPYHIKVRNGAMKLFVELLRWAYQIDARQVVDETGYTGMVDIDIQTVISNPNELNKALAPYGLTFTKQKRKIELLEIREIAGASGNLNKAERAAIP